MFSALLGFAGSALGAFSSMQAAKAQERMAQEELQLKRQAMAWQQYESQRAFGLQEDQLRREREQEKWLRDLNSQNSRYLANEYVTRLNSQKERQQLASQERRYMLDRQVEMDKKAAENRQFNLERYLDNKDISKAEREWAQSQLEEAKAIAKGERDEDMRNFYEERAMAQQERDFAIEQMYGAQDIARRERLDDVAYRNRILDRTDNLYRTLSEAQDRLGEAPDVFRLTKEDIDGETNRREAIALADADRATARVASANEAALIRGGIDASTTGQLRRGEIAGQAALDYQKARQAARDEALRYMSGQQDTLNAGVKADLDRRNFILSEIGNVEGAGIQQMMQMPALRSANDYRTPVNIGSGIFTRNTRSAGDFRAPVNIGSEIYDNTSGIDLGMAGTLNAPSAASMWDLNPGSRVQSAQNWQVSSPSAYGNQGVSMLGSYAQGFDPNSFFKRATEYGAAAGSSLRDAIGHLGGFLDQKFGGSGGGGSFGAQYGLTGSNFNLNTNGTVPYGTPMYYGGR